MRKADKKARKLKADKRFEERFWKCEVGDWTYIEDGLPEPLTQIHVACRAKDGSRPNWVAYDCIYSKCNLTKNPWGIPILDFDNRYEVYAWIPIWCPKPPKERHLNGGRYEEYKMPRSRTV